MTVLGLIAKEKKEKTGRLDLSWQGIKKVPSEIVDLVWLETLILYSNQISDYYFLKKLSNLRSLNISSNKIRNISFLKDFVNLQFLDLSSNQINDYSFLEKLVNLQTLDLSDNQISNIGFLEKLTNLQHLYLGDNQIYNRGIYIRGQNPQTIYIENDGTVDDVFKKQGNLQTLDLSNNQINNISFLESLNKLKVLSLKDNQIKDIRCLESLTNLQTLELGTNKISDIRFLENHYKLQSLDLGGNRINDISSLKNLVNLQNLDLQSNQIKDISFLDKLTNLQSLVLIKNKINNIASLKNLIVDKGINLSINWEPSGIIIGGNPLTIPPKAIVEQGTDVVVNWLEQMAEGEEPLYESKLMVLGQGSAGKTTLTNLLLDENYLVKKGKESSTLGVVVHKEKKFQHIKKNKQKIKAHLWDFGGQDIQKMLHQFFITENCLYIIVSDKRAENENFDYWFQIISLLGPKSSVIVLENPINIESSNEDFPINKYRELYKDLSIDCIEVNLKYTRGNNKTKWKLFKETIEKKLSTLEVVNRSVPQKWTLVRNELGKLSDKKYFSKDLFYAMCSAPRIGLIHKQSDLCLFYLRMLGDLEYFDDRELCNYIFLDHNWLTQGLYYILSDSKIKKEKGRFNRQQAYDQWDSFGYNENEKAMLIQLLLKDKFDICYELKREKDVFITPLLLPSDKPEIWKLTTNLHFRYQYSFLPHGMFSRLIVRIHEKIDNEQKWKTGVRLIDRYEGEDILAEVQQITDPESSQKLIDIKIHGSKEGCKSLLSFIRNEIEELHKDFKNIQFHPLVGCNCDTCSSLILEGENSYFHSLEKLQSKIKNRKYWEECPNSDYQDVNIGQILNDLIIENAANNNLDSLFIQQLKEMGISINQIKNENKVEMSNFGNSSSSSISESSADAKAVNKVSIEINNILGETENLKEDIGRELKIKKISQEEIEYAKSDVEVFENALKEVETANNENKEIPSKSKSRMLRFWEDIKDEESSIHKALKILRKGKDYGIKLAKLYSNIPGVPSIPPIALEVIEKL